MKQEFEGGSSSDEKCFKFKYFAFISYSRNDSRIAKWLQRRLEWFRVPITMVPFNNRPSHPKYIRPVYRDKTNLEVDHRHYWENIKNAIEESRFLIVLCSPASAISEPVDLEIRHYLQSRKAAEDTLVPVILAGRVTGEGPEACLPLSLRELGSRITGRNLPTMIADDDGREEEGWENGFVGLVSFLLQIHRSSLADHLRQQERRDAARIRIVAASMALLAVAAGALGYVAFLQSKKATASRNVAIASRDEAEEVLKYLLYKLPSQIDTMQRVDIRKEVMEKVNNYYAKLGIDEKDPFQLREKSTAFTNIGDVSRDAGEMADALSYYEKSLDLDSKLVALEPFNREWKRYLSFSWSRVADTMDGLGRTKEGNERRQHALELLTTIVTEEPDQLVWKRELAKVLGLTGHREQALQLLRDLVKAEPDNLEWQGSLASELREACDRPPLNADPNRSLATAQEAVMIFRKLQGLSPASASNQMDLAEGLSKLSWVLARQNKFEPALGALDESIKWIRQLVELDGKNLNWHFRLGESLSAKCSLMTRSGDVGGAAGALAEAVEIFKRVVEADPNRAQWRRALAISVCRAGDIATKENRLNDAIRSYAEGLLLLRKLHNTGKDTAASVEALGDLRVALMKSGEVSLALRDLEGAAGAFREIVQMFRGAPPEIVKEPEMQYQFAKSLAQLANVLTDQGHSESARSEATASMEIYRKLREKSPGQPLWNYSALLPEFILGRVECQKGNLLVAKKHFKRVLSFIAEMENSRVLDPFELSFKNEVIEASKDLELPVLHGDQKEKDAGKWLEVIRADSNLPALAALILKGNQIVAAGVAGKRRASHSKPLLIDDRVNVGDVGSMVTTMLAARLVDRGVINWTTPIREIFTNFGDFNPAYYDVTLDELLGHRSGMTNETNLVEDELMKIDADVRTLRRRGCEMMLKVPPATTKGLYSYSRAGYAVAAIMLEDASGKPYVELVQREVFDLLKMETASFGFSFVNEDEPSTSESHIILKRGTIVESEAIPEKRHRCLLAMLGPAAGLLCSIEDAARLVYSSTKGHGVSVLSTESTEHLMSRWNENEEAGRGMAVLRRAWAEPGPALNINAQAFNQSTVVWRAPAKDLTIIVYCNAFSAEGRVFKAMDKVVSKMREYR